MYIVCILGTVLWLVLQAIFFSPSKSSPVYGGVRLIVSGETGCNIVINFGGSFLGLTDF